MTDILVPSEMFFDIKVSLSFPEDILPGKIPLIIVMKWNFPPNVGDFMENSTTPDASVSEWSCPTEVRTADLYIRSCIDESYYTCLLRTIEGYLTEETSTYQIVTSDNSSGEETLFKIPENMTEFPVKIFVALNTTTSSSLRFHGVNPNPRDQHLYMAFVINKEIYDACGLLDSEESINLIDWLVRLLFNVIIE